MPKKPLYQFFPVYQGQRREHHTPRKYRMLPRTKTNINGRKSRNRQHEPTGKEVTVRQNDAPAQFVYGRARVGGVMTFVHNVETLGHLHTVISMTRGLITSIDEVYFNEDRITFGTPPLGWADGGVKPDGTVTDVYANRVFARMFTGDFDQPVQPDLAAQSAALFPGLWTTDHRQRGVGGVYMILAFAADMAPDGLPELSFVVKGKPVYDPRTDTTAYSNNAALVIADYLTDPVNGCGVEWANVDTASLEAAADVCDGAVTLRDGSTEPRYTIDAMFQTDETRKEVLEKMMTAWGGALGWENGQVYFTPAAWVAPAVTLTLGDLRSDVTVKTAISKRDLFNAVRGEFVSPAAGWQLADFPPVTNVYYQEQDGGEQIFYDATYPCTISPATCQRLAKIELERMRQPLEVTATFGLSALAVRAGENVALTMDRYGWTAKPFEVVECEIVLDTSGQAPELAVELQLRETAEGVYDWANGEETVGDLAPNTNLPNPFSVPAVANLALASGTAQLYIRADGTVFTRIKVTWQAFTNLFISSGGFVEIQYKQSAAAEWDSATPVAADNNSTHILDVQDGAFYDVRARARNAVGIVGEWSTVPNYFVVGKTEPPSDVLGFGGTINEFDVRLYWDAVPDLDLSHYELRVSDATQTWATAEFVAEVKATQYVQNLRPVSTYYYLIKAVDTSGNYSQNAAALAVGVTPPSAVQIRHTVVGENIRLEWTQATGPHAIEDYDVRHGVSYDLSARVARIKGTVLNVKGAWVNTRRFWVAAYDVAGNLGIPAFRDVTIYAPFAVVNLTAQVIDNNVLLRWGASPGGTLPVEAYRVYRGDVLESAELIGEVKGTFAAIFEIYAGNYVYWVVPVDTAGNVGQPSQVGAKVDQPPDFELLVDVILDPANADTLDNIRIEKVSAPPEILAEPPIPGTEPPGEVYGSMLTGLTYTGSGLYATPTVTGPPGGEAFGAGLAGLTYPGSA